MGIHGKSEGSVPGSLRNPHQARNEGVQAQMLTLSGLGIDGCCGLSLNSNNRIETCRVFHVCVHRAAPPPTAHLALAFCPLQPATLPVSRLNHNPR